MARGKRGERGRASLQLARKRARLVRTEALVCADKLSRSARELVLSDDAGILEKHLAALARAKGAISEEVYRHILATLEKPL